MTTIKAHIRLEGGQLLSEANAQSIIARHQPFADMTPGFQAYFQRWVVRKEPQGFIFREVSHGAGICGHHPTVRQLVIATLCGLSSDIIVEVEEADCAARQAA